MAEYKSYPSKDAYDRMMLNETYWEEQYVTAQKMQSSNPNPVLPLKICPECGWNGRTSLIMCLRKTVHTHSVRLNIVPAEKEAEVLSYE